MFPSLRIILEPWKKLKRFKDKKDGWNKLIQSEMENSKRNIPLNLNQTFSNVTSFISVQFGGSVNRRLKAVEPLQGKI